MIKTRLKTMGKGVAALTVAGSLAVQTVGGFEGLKLYAYQDVVGVWTACYGETKGIKKGMKFSKADCNNMLVGSLIEHEQGMRACMKDPDGLPIEVYIADLSLAYNIGTGAFCKSTALRQVNVGTKASITASCTSMTAFNKAKGKFYQGLDNRRQVEKKLCLQGAAKLAA